MPWMLARACPWLALVVALLVGVVSSGPAAAADAWASEVSYETHVKATLQRVISGREFKPGAGCSDNLQKLETCAALIARLRSGNFTVFEPIEQSDRADMPSYRRIRNKCSRLDPLHLRASHHITVGTRNFAMYKLDVPKGLIGGDEILVFRAQHYLIADDGPVYKGPDARVIWPGQFVAIGFPSCRQLSNATAQEGDHLAKHNIVGSDDYLTELVKIGDHYFVLNLDPVAGPNQPKVMWWYDLELWDWGPHADADLRHARRVYGFSYRPVSVNLSDRGQSRQSAR
jgi:hypothetical protein